uniref:C2H2-type domain-containing protein n=1 Tax=Heterorhabditis bacteriophora TaxID=37862 RepID=A0A1I7X9W6_HETBA
MSKQQQQQISATVLPIHNIRLYTQHDSYFFYFTTLQYYMYCVCSFFKFCYIYGLKINDTGKLMEIQAHLMHHNPYEIVKSEEPGTPPKLIDNRKNTLCPSTDMLFGVTNFNIQSNFCAPTNNNHDPLNNNHVKVNSNGRALAADRKRPYPCNLCPSRFGSKMELEEHQNSHTGMKPFECDVCKARFNRRSTLWNHKRIHSDAKPFSPNHGISAVHLNPVTQPLQAKVYAYHSSDMDPSLAPRHATSMLAGLDDSTMLSSQLLGDIKTEVNMSFSPMGTASASLNVHLPMQLNMLNFRPINAQQLNLLISDHNSYNNIFVLQLDQCVILTAGQDYVPNFDYHMLNGNYQMPTEQADNQSQQTQHDPSDEKIVPYDQW